MAVADLIPETSKSSNEPATELPPDTTAPALSMSCDSNFDPSDAAALPELTICEPSAMPDWADPVPMSISSAEPDAPDGAAPASAQAVPALDNNIPAPTRTAAEFLKIRTLTNVITLQEKPSGCVTEFRQAKGINSPQPRIS